MCVRVSVRKIHFFLLLVLLLFCFPPALNIQLSMKEVLVKMFSVQFFCMKLQANNSENTIDPLIHFPSLFIFFAIF